MTTPATGAGASSDFFSALNRVIAEARAGAIRAKARANLVMGEGFTQMAAALEQYAKDLQESGQYPAHVWEPVLQGAGQARGAAAHLTESGNAIGEIARTPAGELAGRAPHRDELNKA